VQSDLSASAVDIQALEQNLGSALLKLQYIDQLVKPLPPGALQQPHAHACRAWHALANLYPHMNISVHQSKINQALPALASCTGSDDVLSDALVHAYTFSCQLAARVAAGCTFEVVVYSSSRQGPNMQFFVEDSTQQVELAQPVVAHPVKSLQVRSMMHHAPPLRCRSMVQPWFNLVRGAPLYCCQCATSGLYALQLRVT
jgi:hypothetical protein